MVDKLGFGGAALTSVGNLRGVLNLLDFSYDNGIRHFDTAPLYGQGYSEIIYGKFIKAKRDKITLATKFGFGNINKSHPMLLRPVLFANYWKKKINRKNSERLNASSMNYDLNYRKINKKDIEAEFVKSIKNLNANYLDYYFLHEGIPSFLTDEAFFYLTQLKQNGDVLKIGIGTNINAILKLNTEDVKFWDVLQYEGFDYDLKKTVKTKFQDKEHIHHSCLSRMNNDDQGTNPSHLLAKAVLENLNGKIIFSSRNTDRILGNVKAVSKLNF